jgi:hypothetical protein
MVHNKEYDKEYAKKYREIHREEIKEYNKEYVKKNWESVYAYRKKWVQEHPEARKKIKHNSIEKVRIEVLRILSNGNPVCVNCGCDDIRMLEINHINGGGYQDTKGCRGSRFYQKIKQGKRKTDDLNVLCRICNAWHALELRFGKLPFKITYDRGSYQEPEQETIF